MSDRPQPPPRPADGHKGMHGRVLIIAGSTGMSGAAALAGLGALRGGAGLVTLAVPDDVVSTVAAVEPSYMVVPSGRGGRVGKPVLTGLKTHFFEPDAIAIGPGLSVHADLTPVVEHIYRYGHVACPVVVDADALNILARSDALPDADGPRLLTPHPGEFSRLTGLSVAEIQSDRERHAKEYAARHGVTVLLKGPGTVITDGDRVAVNETGNAGLGTGGTGDVLTGLLVALLGQGMEPFEAARFGAHLHGLAGDLAAAELSEPGLIASDLPLYIGKAWKVFHDRP
ncbi:MAG: NAD(P)H-hydrate dehydratase [Planctomycetota bacterium]